MELKDKVIAITGGAQGLGFSMAQLLGASGAKLALIDRQTETLKQAQARLAQQNISVSVFTADITDESQTEMTFQHLIDEFGQLNGLINCAGIMRDGLLLKVKDGQVTEKLSLAQFQSVLDVNVTGTFLCSREAAMHMVETKSEGVIINISSVSRAGNMGQTNYSASKAAVSTMTVTWAKELARFGIRTGCIAPGLVDTAMAAQMRPEMLEMFKKSVPAGRLAQAEEIAAGVRFIFENDYFTGRTLEIDGGTRI